MPVSYKACEDFPKAFEENGIRLVRGLRNPLTRMLQGFQKDSVSLAESFYKYVASIAP